MRTEDCPSTYYPSARSGSVDVAPSLPAAQPRRLAMPAPRPAWARSRRMPPLLLLLLLSLPVHGASAASRDDGATHWSAVQPPLHAVVSGLWVPDLHVAMAGPEGAASALRQALWVPGVPPASLLPPLFALGEAAARAQFVEVVIESVRLIEDVANLAASTGGAAVPDLQVAQSQQLQRRVAELYTQQFIPLVHAGLVGAADRSNARAKAIGASLDAGSASAATGRGGIRRRVAVGPSAVLLSSSHWATIIITLVRGMHQHPGGSEPWRRMRHNLEVACPSLPQTSADAAWRQLEGAAVVRWATLGRLLEACLVDADAVGTMVRAEGGAVDVSNSAGWTALHHAALLTSGRLAAALLAAGASPFARTSLLGYTALHIAASRGASDVAKVLLSHEPSLISAVDEKNRTAVDIVCLHDAHVHATAAESNSNGGATNGSSWLAEIYHLLRAAGAAPCNDDSSSINMGNGNSGSSGENRRSKVSSAPSMAGRYLSFQMVAV